MQISYLHIQQLLVIIGEWIVALQNKYIHIWFLSSWRNTASGSWFIQVTQSFLVRSQSVNASSILLDHHWLSFIQVLGWALMTNSQSHDLITILAKVKWWVMLCFFQVEQIIHKCCLGVELLHLHASTSPPTWFRVQQFRISMDLNYYVARWEKWSQGSTSPTQAGRFPPKLRPSSYISTTLFVWRILIHNWQVGVQPQEANPLHLFDAYTQVENCKLENPNVQNW